MESESVFRAISLLLLLTLLTSSAAFPPVKAGGTIFIRTDGSVDPPTAPIYHGDGVYRLTGNISTSIDGIIIERDYVRLDGAGYTVQGAEVGNGIVLLARRNVTVENMRICGFALGIALVNSSYIEILGNTATRSVRGFDLSYSSYNRLLDNIVTDCEYGITLLESNHNTLVGNMLAYNVAGVALWHSSYCHLSENTLTENGRGIIFTDSSGEKVFHNNFVENSVQAEINLWCSPHIMWHDGLPSGGNYWSDHAEIYRQATEIDGLGIWNTSYYISRGNTDPYPLAHPFGSNASMADVNGDLRIDVYDVVGITSSYGTTPSDGSWNPNADTGRPYGRIDAFDIALCTSYFGKDVILTPSE